MKRALALLCLAFVAPAHAVLLHFSLGGDAEIGFTPPFVVPFSASYQYRGSPEPSMARFADVESPDGTVVRDYFLGTGSYGGSIPPFPPDESAELGVVSLITLRFSDSDPTLNRPFAFSHSISSVGFNRYLYESEIWMSDPLFGFFSFSLPFSPPRASASWDRAFVESLDDPALLLSIADLDGGSGMFELGQLGISVDILRPSVTDLEAMAVPTPGSLALVTIAAAALCLSMAPLRRVATRSDGIGRYCPPSSGT